MGAVAQDSEIQGFPDQPDASAIPRFAAAFQFSGNDLCEISDNLAVRHGCTADLAESERGMKGIGRGIRRIKVDLAADHGMTIGLGALEEVGIQRAGDAAAARFVRHDDAVYIHEVPEALPEP